MIEYSYEFDFSLVNEARFTDWINRIIVSNEYFPGDISYIFCKDDYLLEISIKYLKHNSYTDIMTFDYTNGELIYGVIFISIERVWEKALRFVVEFQDELLRVL